MTICCEDETFYNETFTYSLSFPSNSIPLKIKQEIHINNQVFTTIRPVANEYQINTNFNLNQLETTMKLRIINEKNNEIYDKLIKVIKPFTLNIQSVLIEYKKSILVIGVNCLYSIQLKNVELIVKDCLVTSKFEPMVVLEGESANLWFIVSLTDQVIDDTLRKEMLISVEYSAHSSADTFHKMMFYSTIGSTLNGLKATKDLHLSTLPLNSVMFVNDVKSELLVKLTSNQQIMLNQVFHLQVFVENKSNQNVVFEIKQKCISRCICLQGVKMQVNSGKSVIDTLFSISLERGLMHLEFDVYVNDKPRTIDPFTIYVY
jgi:hypothetical protein